jgi:hypothetical protein
VPAVNVGTRQQGRDRGANVVDVPHDRREIRRAIQAQLLQDRPLQDTLYGCGDAGRKIADVLATAPLEIEKRLDFERDHQEGAHQLLCGEDARFRDVA